MFEALAALLTAGSQAAANAQQVQMERERLAFEKENARKQYNLATAARTDAYGNRTSFDDLMNEWLTQLTPTQESILKAGEREQRLGLTHDAPQARDLRDRQYARSLEAENAYHRKLTDHLYNPPPSEESIRGQYDTDLAFQRSQEANDRGALIGRSLLRGGRGRDLPSLYRQIAQSISEDAAGDPLRARQAALNEWQGRDTKYRGDLAEIQALEGIMDDVGQGTLRFSDAPQTMTQQQRDMLSSIAGALSNESNQVGGAMSRVAQALGHGRINFSGLGGLDSMFKMGGSGKVSGSAAPAVATDSQIPGLFQQIASMQSGIGPSPYSFYIDNDRDTGPGANAALF